ncbi:1-phosphatidylinositol 4,5-bisphosphate phosphodiesterase classes I and II-like isoform X2 [Brevipalpus obovatus]|uniref:1-phosphatidylinositol 4,5-bisphosphate phosphodiesterase classes I and II-like isoform X2 n=1 Tax=Brevipalpus obovatus TaxID=246614 RepID=UPI003D9F2146
MASGKAGVHVVTLKPISVPESLQKGCKFVKWDEDSTIGTHVTLYVDPRGFFLFWKDGNNEIEYLEISSIRDTRTGRYARVPREGKLRDSVNSGPSDVPLEDKTFTVCYGPDFVNVSFINFVCTSREDAQEWTDSVLKMALNLLALNSSSYVFLAKAHTKIRLMCDREGKIPVKNVVKLFAQHKDDKKRVEKALDSCGLPSGKSDSIDPDNFTLTLFLQFYKQLCVRSEVEKIFDRLTKNDGGNKKPGQRLMTVDQLVDFLNREQRDPRLNEILYPYADRAKGKELISQYEPNEENVKKACFSFEGFMYYLMSDDNAIVAPEKFDFNLDMDQPLNHYFTNSSHNTYLTGHQLTGKASVEVYRQCLLAGCRCIELDCWNGRKNEDEEPIITHGYTVVSDIPCKDVLEAIAETAFKTSVYPVILSFENHCSSKQQAKIAQYCRKIFGDMLLTEPLSSHPLKQGVSLPSPNALMRKILIKNKKKHHKIRKRKGTTATVTLSSATTTANIPTTSSSNTVPTSSPIISSTTAISVTSVADSVSQSTTCTSSIDSKQVDNISSSGLGSSVTGSDGRPALTANNSDESGGPMEDNSSSQLVDSDECPSGSIMGTFGGLTGPPSIAVKQSISNTNTCDIEEIESDSSLDDDEVGPPSEAGGGTSGGSVGDQPDGDATPIKEAEACDDMSALVNYIQPVNFTTFDYSEKRNRSYEISSFVETQATSLLKERPVDFVNLNKVQLSRIYPKGTRVDSSNYLPQIFWNAGCQMVALNFQTLDLGMQLNLGLFEYNGRSGYLLKPDFMRRLDRKFDPFTESTVDGIIAGTVSVKIISGQFLSDKRTGTYVDVDMFGLPADTVRRKRTKIVPNNGINPIYDEEPFIFKKVVLPDLACLRIAAYEESGKLIGHRILPIVGLRPGYRHIALRNESGQPLTLPTLFVHITVKDYVPDGLSELADALANPIAYQSMFEKRAKQLQALTDDKDEEDTTDSCSKNTGNTAKSSSNDPSSVNFTGISSNKADSKSTSDEKRSILSSSRADNATGSSASGGGGVSSASSGSSGGIGGCGGSAGATASGKSHGSMNGSVQKSSGLQSSSSPGHMNRPPLLHQDTFSMRMNQSVRSLSDEASNERTPSLLESERARIEVDSLEKLKQHRDVVKVKLKLEKELQKLRKKHEKARSKEIGATHQRESKIIGGQIKNRSVLSKTLSKKSPSQDSKNLMKRQSEVDIQHSSPEAQSKLQELHKSYSQSMKSLLLKHYDDERELLERYQDKYYAALESAMQSSQSAQLQYLQGLHDKEVAGLKKKEEAQIKGDLENLNKRYKDKNEFSRIKRELQVRLVDQAVKERQRLGNLLEQRKSELQARHDEIRKELEKDHSNNREKLRKEYTDRCEKLSSEFQANSSMFMPNLTRSSSSSSASGPNI